MVDFTINNNNKKKRVNSSYKAGMPATDMWATDVRGVLVPSNHSNVETMSHRPPTVLIPYREPPPSYHPTATPTLLPQKQTSLIKLYKMDDSL